MSSLSPTLDVPAPVIVSSSDIGLLVDNGVDSIIDDAIVTVIGGSEGDGMGVLIDFEAGGPTGMAGGLKLDRISRLLIDKVGNITYRGFTTCKCLRQSFDNFFHALTMNFEVGGTSLSALE